MLKKAILLSFLFLLFTNINAQDKIEEKPKHTFDVYLYGGIGVSYYYYKCENSSLRVDLDFSSSYSNEDGDYSQNSIGSDYSNKTAYDYDVKNTNFTIALASHYFYDFYKSSYGKAYFGFGPFINYNTSDYVNNRDYTNDDNSKKNEKTDEQTEWAIGLSAIVGIKSTLTKSLYLFAETKLSGGKSFLDRNYTSIEKYVSNEYNSESSKNGDSWYYNLRYVRVGIGISL